MKITQEEIVDSETVIHIELEDPDLSPYLDQGYRRVVQRVIIPGFRKGKAPRRIVETFVGRESLLNEVLDSMVMEVTSQAVKEQELDATGLPKIEMVEFEPFTLTFMKSTLPATGWSHAPAIGSALPLTLIVRFSPGRFHPWSVTSVSFPADTTAGLANEIHGPAVIVSL